MRQYPRVIYGILVFAWAVLRGGIVWLLTRDMPRAVDGVTRRMAVHVCRIVRLDVRLLHFERLLMLQPCVVIANHQSIADLQVLAHLYRRVERPVVLAKLVGKWNLPVLKHLFVHAGNVVVDPRTPLRSGLALRRALRALRRGCTVMLYPEGSRRDDGRIGPFMPGAFRLAIEAQRPVVPVVVSHFKPSLDLRAGIVRRQQINIRVLEPVPTVGLTARDLPHLRDRVRGLMQAALDADDSERGLPVTPLPSSPAPDERELVPV